MTPWNEVNFFLVRAQDSVEPPFDTKQYIQNLEVTIQETPKLQTQGRMEYSGPPQTFNLPHDPEKSIKVMCYGSRVKSPIWCPV